MILMGESSDVTGHLIMLVISTHSACFTVELKQFGTHVKIVIHDHVDLRQHAETRLRFM